MINKKILIFSFGFFTALSSLEAGAEMICDPVEVACQNNPDWGLCKQSFSGYVKVGGITGLYGEVATVCAPGPGEVYTHAQILVSRARNNLKRDWCWQRYYPIPFGNISCKRLDFI